MIDVEKYERLFKAHNGVVKMSDFTSEGYHNTLMSQLIKKGYVEKIKAGYYEWIGGDPISDAVIIRKLFPEGVVCMESALYLYGYTERTPKSWHIAVSKNGKTSKYSIEYPPIQFYFLIDKYMEIGRSEVIFESYPMSVFDRDRTICDIIRYEKKIDKEIFNYAVKAYVKDPRKNIGQMLDYAQKMRIKNKVSNVIGMWM